MEKEKNETAKENAKLFLAIFTVLCLSFLAYMLMPSEAVEIVVMK